MTKRVVLIGHPVAHSLSGAMQQAAFDAAGIPATYELWDRAPAELADAIAELRTDEFLGANVTIPHKEKAAGLVDRLTEEAHATGAVNTITREGKRLVGHNTDVPGFRAALDALVGKQRMPRAAVVLGSGRRRPGGRPRPGHRRASSGSSSSTATSTGPRRSSASSARAPPTWSCGRCRGTSRSSRPSWRSRRFSSTRRRSASTTTRRPIPGELIPPDLLVMDLIYNPARSRLLRDAEAAGCQVQNGELMLLHQGAAAFTPVDRPAGAARAHAREAGRGAGRGRGDRGRRGRRRARARPASRAPDGGHDRRSAS